MKMAKILIKVNCYSGFKGEERPVSFTIGEKTFQVVEQHLRGVFSGNRKLKGMCKPPHDHRDGLWTFLDVAGNAPVVMRSKSRCAVSSWPRRCASTPRSNRTPAASASQRQLPSRPEVNGVWWPPSSSKRVGRALPVRWVRFLPPPRLPAGARGGHPEPALTCRRRMVEEVRSVKKLLLLLVLVALGALVAKKVREA